MESNLLIKRIISKKIAKILKICPLKVANGLLTVYVADEYEFNSIDFFEYIEQIEATKVKKILKPLSFVLNEIEKLYDSEIKSATDNYNTTTTLQLLIEQTILEAEFDDCTDVHIEPTSDYLRIRYRKNGNLTEVNRLNMSTHSAISNYIKLRALLDISESRIPQDGQIQFVWNNKVVNCRISCIPTIKGESFAIRILREGANFNENFNKISQLYNSINEYVLQKNNGLWLISGPTGSGKTTSFYALLSKFFEENRQIVTFEDPVEYKLNLFTQIQLGAGITCQNAVRTVLRQSADIIGVGEIRNHDMLKLAVNSAITGHCVIATVHANDAESTLSRIKQFGGNDSTIDNVIRGILSQKFLNQQHANLNNPTTTKRLLSTKWLQL